nr:tetratricopeptide repeat protein 37 isoform X2 [Parasteatoda tepidariorum]
MASKDTKSLLKQAREAIKEKDFKSALKFCKVVLQSEKDNYNAWVFVGVAAQEIDQPDQSVAAFKRAIEISPKQPLAWQGLCSFYEKNESPENIPKLVSVYKELLELSSPDKKLDIFDKLIPLLRKLNDKEKVIKTLKLKLELVKGTKEENAIYRSIFSELTGITKLTTVDMETQIEVLQRLVDLDEFSEDDCQRIISDCVNPLYKEGEESHSLKLAFIIFRKHPNNLACLEFISRAAMNFYIEKDLPLNGLENISEKIKSYEKMNSKGLPQIFEGFCSFVSKNYFQAIQKLKEGLSKMEYCVQGWYFLSKSQLKLHQYSDAEVSATTAITVGRKSKVSSKWIGKFYLNLGQVLLGRQNWDGTIGALEKCLEYMEQTKEMRVTLCFTLLRIGKISNAEQILHDLKEKYPEDPEILQLEGYSLLLKKDLIQALQRFRLSVSLQESSFTLHLIGVVLWETKQGEKAFKVFMKAAESDPYFAKNFLYLGHHYYFNLNDKSKAVLCYEKAFSLDNSDTEIGMSLSQMLKELKKEEENMIVLKKITENASLGSCKWAWTQLGLYYLEKNNFNDAIFSLQKALRADPDSSHGWECLADAYFKRGSYESALKAYERVYEINSRAMYPLYQIATIQKMRGIFTEAIEKFKSLLNTVPTYIPALIGLAESLVLHARRALDDCLFGVAKDSCQEALDILSRVAKTNNGLSCLWKLAGDACTIPYHLNEKWFPFNVPVELVQDSKICESVSCDKLQILSFGARFFGRALLIKDSVSTLWHDLGVNYHYQSTLSNNPFEFSKKAFTCLQKAISICPINDAHWRTLGVIALGEGLKDFAFGQHALVKSLLVNRHDAETWTNLGILYLLNQNIKLSHFAFKMAQSAEPSYPLSWIGQAFIAEKVKHSETLDLFRHATTLGSHNEALAGYSKAVCEALLNTEDKNSLSYKYNIEEMDAVVRAADCSIKFIANNHNSAEMNNILGILLERQRICNGSLLAYERALNLMKDNNETEFDLAVRINFARVLSSVGQMKEAIKNFLLVTKKTSDDTSVICSLAFALYKDKQYEPALKLFAQAFEKCKIPANKSHIKVAMAMVATNIKGPDSPNHLTLLFESIQISPASVYGLLALYSGGILNEKLDLLLAARKELYPYRFTQQYASSTALLWASHYYIMKGTRPARNELLKYMHCLPSDNKIWLQAAACLLQWGSESVAAYCTKVSVFHGGCKEEASQIFALSQMSNRKEALSAAQKVVHINPGKLTNWATLAAACHVADLDRKHVGWMFGFVKKLAKEQKVKPDFLGWLVVMEIFHHINCGDLSAASTLMSQVLPIKSFNSEITSCLQILDAVIKVFSSSSGNLQPLFLAIKNNPKSFFGWSVLSQLLLDSGNDVEAEKMLSHFIVSCEKMFPKWTAYPLLQLAILSYRALQVAQLPEEREKWLHLGVEVSGKAVHAVPSNQAARFLQGLFALESGNTSLARRCFEKASALQSNGRKGMWMEKMANDILMHKNLKRK